MAVQLHYGGVPVPYTVTWTGEDGSGTDEPPFYLAECPHFRALAICQPDARGIGMPQFGKPHSNRQRLVIAKGLCDLCGRPLKAATKVSLSHAKVRLDGALGPCVMQVEPLLHRLCARRSLRHCPSLRRDIREGVLQVRQVNRYQVQAARMACAYVKELTGHAVEALGHAKVVLLQWQDRDEAWLREVAA